MLDDVLGLCDDVTVLRDGSVVGGGAAAELGVERMIRLMVGRALDPALPAARGRAAGRGTRARGARASASRASCAASSFQLRAGEVLGLAGLMGSGRSELARILFGLDPFAAGTIGRRASRSTAPDPPACMARGVAFLTEDRRAEGLLMEASIHDNVALPSLDDFASGWARLIQRTRLGDAVDPQRPTPCGSTPRTISARWRAASRGGNQQKVVLAKWLLREPKLFILDEPTRGIDVGAKYEVYKIVASSPRDGAAVLMISSEIEELMGMCDRILVMSHGEIRAEHRAGTSSTASGSWNPPCGRPS